MLKLCNLGLALCAFGMLSACASVATQSSVRAVDSVDPMTTGTGSGSGLSPFGLMPTKTRDQVAAIARRANSSPLGSKENPVRASMPEGQRAYLSRLVCPNGGPARFERTFNLGPGIYGTIIDEYKVRCPGQPEATIIMDMYHDWSENRPVPGFTIRR
jgi:hypothetical protein